MEKLKKRVRRAGAAAGLVLLASAVVPALSLYWVDQARAERDRVQLQIDGLRRYEALLVDAETGQRGFVITGKDEFLQPYLVATQQIPAAIVDLQRQFVGELEVELHILEELESVSHRKMDELAETVALRRTQGFQAVEPIVTAGAGRRFMDKVRSMTADLGSRKKVELQLLETSLAAKIRWAMLLSAVSTLFSIGVFAILGRTLWSEIRLRELLSQKAAIANMQLEQGMRTLKSHSEEVSALSEMARVLQAEMSLREALAVTAQFCGRLLTETNGAIHLFRNSADLLERAAEWGDPEPAGPTMDPKACWGLRLGRPHRGEDSHGLRCLHYRKAQVCSRQLCIPLMAYGELLGLMEIAWSDDATHLGVSISALAQTIAEQAALALSNAKLRQVLRDQSIKDPLTGLYNRRYMEETLSRELARSDRNKKPLSLIMVDLDHFKRINDTHGHPAGDAVLRAAGRCLGGAVRESDVACRFGGEEFVLILPDCPPEAAIAKANELCESVRLLRFIESGEAVQITASFGVASYPADGVEAQGLVQAADAALYQAKTSGRNRVVAAGQPAPGLASKDLESEVSGGGGAPCSA